MFIIHHPSSFMTDRQDNQSSSARSFKQDDWTQHSIDHKIDFLMRIYISSSIREHSVLYQSPAHAFSESACRISRQDVSTCNRYAIWSTDKANVFQRILKISRKLFHCESTAAYNPISGTKNREISWWNMHDWTQLPNSLIGSKTRCNQ